VDIRDRHELGSARAAAACYFPNADVMSAATIAEASAIFTRFNFEHEGI